MLLHACSLLQAAALRRIEDQKVAAAVRSGRYVDIGVHSFLPTLPPQQLSIPADATVSFLKRQIAQRIQACCLSPVSFQATCAEHSLPLPAVLQRPRICL